MMTTHGPRKSLTKIKKVDDRVDEEKQLVQEPATEIDLIEEVKIEKEQEHLTDQYYAREQPPSTETPLE